MRIGLVQPLVGHIGGNDKVLESLFDVFQNHKLELFSFSKVEKQVPKNVTTHVKVSKHIPLLGIYQKLIMPQHDYSKCDVVISTTGYPVKTSKKLIIYDQNNLGDDFEKKIPLKYQHGLWRLYYLPYRLLNRPRIIEGATYISNSKYSSDSLFQKSGIRSSVIYPCVKLDEFYSLPKKPQICVIGRISPEKNLEETVRILNHVKFPSIIFGNVTATNRKYFEKLKRLAKSNVIILDNLPREKLLYLMAESKVIFTASKETFGIATVEGIASGCIPVVPDNSAHPEIVFDESLRYHNPEEAVRIINRIMAGDYHNKELLRNHIDMFSFENFNRSFSEVV